MPGDWVSVLEQLYGLCSCAQLASASCLGPCKAPQQRRSPSSRLFDVITLVAETPGPTSSSEGRRGHASHGFTADLHRLLWQLQHIVWEVGVLAVRGGADDKMKPTALLL